MDIYTTGRGRCEERRDIMYNYQPLYGNKRASSVLPRYIPAYNLGLAFNILQTKKSMNSVSCCGKLCDLGMATDP